MEEPATAGHLIAVRGEWWSAGLRQTPGGDKHLLHEIVRLFAVTGKTAHKAVERPLCVQQETLKSRRSQRLLGSLPDLRRPLCFPR